MKNRIDRPVDEALKLPPNSLLIFVDETGNEDLSDPNNPTFGRGGCGALFTEYNLRISNPWKRLKRERLGGATKRFHAADFEQTRPSMRQIHGINNFMARPFWRFATMCDARTDLPPGIDAHKAISLVTIQYFSRLVAKLDVDVVALIFEGSERGDSLVQRDYELAPIDFRNVWGRRVEVEGCLMPKSSLEPGRPDRAHCGKAASPRDRWKAGSYKDFEKTYWHSHIPPEFTAITSVEISEGIRGGLMIPRREE
jgi:hypothetical protein